MVSPTVDASAKAQRVLGATRGADKAPGTGLTRPSATPAPGAPNVVLITTDDQTLADMKYLPRTRRLLGGRGATFTNMLSPHPLCCPARAEILTGQYAQNNGVHTNAGAHGGYPALRDPDNTLPRWLQDAGYETAMFGKFLNRWSAVRDPIQSGWSTYKVAPGSSFGYYNFNIFDDSHIRGFKDGTSYSTTYVTDQTVAHIQEWSRPQPDSTRRPFFIWTSYYAPHGLCGESDCKRPPEPEHKYAKAFAGERAPTLAKKSYRAPLVDPNPMIAGRPVVPVKDVQADFLARIRALQSVDDGVTRIVAALKAEGTLDNTLILFTSDNGYLLGEHHYTGKVVGYDESLRVPLLMRGPGIPSKVKRSSTVTTVDLAATIASAAGATPGRVVDGRDLLPAAQDGEALSGDTILIQAGTRPRDQALGPWLYRGVRTSRYTYTTWKVGRGKRFVELFDRRRDPLQITNVARDPRLPRRSPRPGPPDGSARRVLGIAGLLPHVRRPGLTEPAQRHRACGTPRPVLRRAPAACVSSSLRGRRRR